MKNRLLCAVVLISLFSIAIYYLISNEKIEIKFFYWLPYVWLIIILICFNFWKFNKAKLFLILHSFILMCGIFSFLAYQIFKKLSNITLLSSNNFTDVSNLMFNSENALYIMVYSGIILLIIDLIYFYKLSKK